MFQTLPESDAKADLNKGNFRLCNKLHNLKKDKELIEIMKPLINDVR